MGGLLGFGDSTVIRQRLMGKSQRYHSKKLRDDLNSVMQEYKEKSKNIAAGHAQNFIKKLDTIIIDESEDTLVEQ